MVVGPNGAGKTNFLEGVHVGTQGSSLRTRRDARTVRFGCDHARVTTSGTTLPGRGFTAQVTISASGGKTVTLNGASAEGSAALRRQFPVLAFTPDRLAVVKGGPLVRRTYLDRALGRILPARADLPVDYAKVLAQRNAGLRRVRVGESSRVVLAPWTETLARLGTELDAARHETVASLAPRFTSHAAGLGLVDAALSYDGEGVTVAELEARTDRDVERGTTGAGPHLRDVALTAGGRDLRFFGSQGEQRTAVLALLLAEAGSLAEAHDHAPLLLLDDVLSELDDGRKTAFVAGLPEGGQAFVTATSLRSLPQGCPEPALVVDVSPGEARLR